MNLLCPMLETDNAECTRGWLSLWQLIPPIVLASMGSGCLLFISLECLDTLEPALRLQLQTLPPENVGFLLFPSPICYSRPCTV